MDTDLLIPWLNDAYAMEQALLPILDQHARDAESGGMPEAAIRIHEHIDETRKQLDRLEQCFTKLGSSPSAVKSTLGSLVESAQSLMTTMFSDKAVKNVILDFGIEQFEIAAYRALVAAAKELDEGEIATLCEDNLHEERTMATWLEDHIPSVVSIAMRTESTARR